MSITQNFPVYTGTFTTKRGVERKMSFVKLTDMPKSITSVFSRSRKLQPGFETVYDVEKSAYRTFNYNTLVGKIVHSSQVVTIQG